MGVELTAESEMQNGEADLPETGDGPGNASTSAKSVADESRTSQYTSMLDTTSKLDLVNWLKQNDAKDFKHHAAFRRISAQLANDCAEVRRPLPQLFDLVLDLVTSHVKSEWVADIAGRAGSGHEGSADCFFEGLKEMRPMLFLNVRTCYVLSLASFYCNESEKDILDKLSSKPCVQALATMDCSAAGDASFQWSSVLKFVMANPEFTLDELKAFMDKLAIGTDDTDDSDSCSEDQALDSNGDQVANAAAQEPQGNTEPSEPSEPEAAEAAEAAEATGNGDNDLALGDCAVAHRRRRSKTPSGLPSLGSTSFKVKWMNQFTPGNVFSQRSAHFLRSFAHACEDLLWSNFEACEDILTISWLPTEKAAKTTKLRFTFKDRLAVQQSVDAAKEASAQALALAIGLEALDLPALAPPAGQEFVEPEAKAAEAAAPKSRKRKRGAPTPTTAQMRRKDFEQLSATLKEVRLWLAGDVQPEASVGSVAVADGGNVTMSVYRSWKWPNPIWTIPCTSDAAEVNLDLKFAPVDCEVLFEGVNVPVKLNLPYLVPNEIFLKQVKALKDTDFNLSEIRLVRAMFPTEEKGAKADLRNPLDRFTTEQRVKEFLWQATDFKPSVTRPQPQPGGDNPTTEAGGDAPVENKKLSKKQQQEQQQQDSYFHVRDFTYKAAAKIGKSRKDGSEAKEAAPAAGAAAGA